MSLVSTAVSGGHRHMGTQQGEAFGSHIQRALDFYERLARRNGTTIGALEKTLGPYIDAARKHLPDLAEEVEGIADGSRIDRQAIWMLNCLEEVWPAEACTTLAVGDFLLHAEQWYAGHDGVGVVVAHPHDGPSFVSPTCAGFLPAVGMNSSGFAQGIDSLEAADDRIGIPRVLVSRNALGAPGMGAAIEAARAAGRAGGYAHVLASPDRRIVVETSATRDDITQNCVAHTNHYLSTSFGDVTLAPSGGSQDRLSRARHLAEFEPPKSLDDCVRILSDHEGGRQTICLHEEDRLGAGATAFGMACDVRTGCLMVSDGPPCAGKWLEFEVPNYDWAGLVGAG